MRQGYSGAWNKILINHTCSIKMKENIKTRYAKCQQCPAYHLLTVERKKQIEIWEGRRDRYISRMIEVKLVLLGESMPANRYFYDINTDYEGGGLRYSLKKEFGNLNLSDSQFLESFRRKGIVLFDCALCPLHALQTKALSEANVNCLRRNAATHCFLTITKKEIEKYSDIPIVTVFPSNLGLLKKNIPIEIISRFKGECTFSNQSGLANFFAEMKTHKNNN